MPFASDGIGRGERDHDGRCGLVLSVARRHGACCVGKPLPSVHSTTRKPLEDVLALVARGAVKPVISGVHPLSEIRQVHERVGRGGVPGRVVVKP